MSAARQGFKWWEVDVTYYVLCGLEKLGIVSELRPPPAHVLNGSRVISAETKERIAQALAHRFCPDRIVHRMQNRWVELNRGHAIAAWRRQRAAQTSAQRRVGKECVSTCIAPLSPQH